MKGTDLLKADHDRVKGLFRQCQQTTDPAQRRRIAEQAFTELEVHTKLEEEVFYPAFRSVADVEGQALVAESFEDHHEMEDLVQKLRAMDPSSPQYASVLQDLQRAVEEHISVEEGEMFPEAEARFGPQLEQLGAEMQRRKQELTGRAA